MRILPEPFTWAVVSNRQKRADIAGMTTVKKLINKSGSFEDSVKFKSNLWNCLRMRDAHEYLLQFVKSLQVCFEYTAVCAC